MFAQAREYEPFMGRWSRKLAPLLVEFAGVEDGESILDVGTGTGVLAAAIAAAKPAAQVVGVDPSPSYVATARAQARSGRIRYLVGDAQTLDFAEDTFHRTISQLVLNFVADPAKALAEQVRVTHVGGVVVAAVWDYGDGMQMLRIFWEEAVSLDPAAAARDERTMPLSRHSELSSLWLAQGLLAVGERPLVIEQRFASFDDFWRPFLGGEGPAGGYVASLTDARREALRTRLRQRLFDGQPDGPMALEARAWAVKGYVPPRPARAPWSIDRRLEERGRRS